MTTKPHVAIYLRVSTDEQDDARQIEGCHRCAELHFPDLPVERYREPGVSAFKNSIFDRPESKRMIAAILEGKVAGIVADAQDRLSRGRQSELWAFLELCEEHGIQIVTVADGPLRPDDELGEVMLAFRQAQARSESVKRQHRIRSSFEELARQGYWTNGVPPYGFKIVGPKRQRTLHALPFQAGLVRRAFEMYASGDHSMNKVAQWLAAEDPSRSGYRQNVRDDILSNPAYIGKQRRLGEVIDSQHDGIVSEQLWDAVQTRLANIQRHPGHVQPFGSALLRCDCGGRLVYHRDKRGEEYRGAWGYHCCLSCGRSHVSEYVEASVVLALTGVAWTLDNELRQPTFEPGSTPEEVEALRSSIRAVEEGIEALTQAVQAGSKVVIPRLVEKEAELDGLRSLLAKHQATTEEIRASWRHVRDEIRRFNVTDWHDHPELHDEFRVTEVVFECWMLATPEQKKQLVQTLIDRITVESERMLLDFRGAGFARPIPVPLVTGNRHKPISRVLRDAGLGAGGAIPAAVTASPS